MPDAPKTEDESDALTRAAEAMYDAFEESGKFVQGRPSDWFGTTIIDGEFDLRRIARRFDELLNPRKGVGHRVGDRGL